LIKYYRVELDHV